MIEHLNFSNTKILSSFWFPFKFSSMTEGWKFQGQNTWNAPKGFLRIRLQFRYSSALIFKELLLAVFYVSYHVWIVIQEET